MGETSDGKNVHIPIEAAAPEEFLQRFRAEVRRAAVHSLTVDMQRIARVDLALLSALRTAGEEARQADKEAFLEGTGTVVYKALHLAKLASLFKRVE